MIKKGQELDVIVLNIDKERRRISLGHKQTIENPWAKLAVTYAVGNAVEGNISRILERGVVVDLEGHVEGFVPISQLGIDDLQRPDEYFEEGDEMPLKVVEFDEDQKKIVLSVRERLRDADQDEIDAFLAAHPRREGAEVAVEAEVAEEEVEVEEVEGAVEVETEAETETAEAEAEVEAEAKSEDESQSGKEA